MITGCSAITQTWQPVPGNFSASRDLPVESAPLVVAPLDISTLTRQPCVGLTHDQLAPYMGTIREQETQRDEKSLACDWYADDGNRNSVSLFVYPKTSVAEMYGASLGFSYFDRSGPKIGAYPTVRKSQLALGSRYGDCITEVAVSDRASIAIYAYTITKSDPNYLNMCSVSDTLVAHAIDHLRSGR